ELVDPVLLVNKWVRCVCQETIVLHVGLHHIAPTVKVWTPLRASCVTRKSEELLDQGVIIVAHVDEVGKSDLLSVAKRGRLLSSQLSLGKDWEKDRRQDGDDRNNY